MTHLVIHTQYYPPEMGAPQARLSELAAALVRRGHRVTVLTAMPNYPVGQVFRGYGGWLKKEQQEGVQVIRTAIFPSQSASMVPRLLSYFSFVFSSLLVGGWFIQRADYLLTESPPLFLGIAGYLLSRWKHARWIFNVSDLWPESALHLGVIQKGLLYKLACHLEAFCYKKSWLVTGQSKAIIKCIHRRFPEVRTYHFSNGVDIERFSIDRNERGNILKENKNGVVAIYAGLHGIAQGLDQILQAADQLRDIEDLHFVLVGDGPEKRNLVKMAESLRLPNVTFLDAVPRAEVPTLLASADMCLIPLKRHLPGAVPSKIYEAMASARPIILVAEDEPAEIVNSHRAGLVVSPGSISEFSAAILKLYKDYALRHEMGQNGLLAAKEYYNRQIILDEFTKVLLES